MKYDYSVFNKESNIAIVTLWTKKEEIIELLRKSNVLDKVHMIGTLYTAFGINYFIKTLGNSNINTIIICGADLSESAHSLIKLREIDLCIAEDVSQFIANLRIIDARENFNQMYEIIEKSYAPIPHYLYDFTIKDNTHDSITKSYPHALSGNLVYDSDIFRAWVKILDNIVKFGVLKSSNYGEMQKQFLNNMCVIAINKNPEEIILNCYSKMLQGHFSEREIENHVNSILSDKKPAVEYTYGERLNNQIQLMINELKVNPCSRRVIGLTWCEEKDRTSANPPCLLLVQGDITQNIYNHTVYFRSNDMVKAFPINIIGQIMLARYIAGALGSSVGSVTLISSSAHIYEHDFSFVSELLNKQKSKLYEFVPDPKGNFIIDDSIKQRTEKEILWELKEDELENGNLYTLPSHALFVGKEIMKRRNHYISEKD
jgi:thymidylate synthase